MYILSSTLIILFCLTLKNYLLIDSSLIILIAFISYFILYKIYNNYIKRNVDRKFKRSIIIALTAANLLGYMLFANLNLIRSVSYFIIVLTISTIVFYLSLYENTFEK